MATAQVKNGGEDLDPADYHDYPGEVFLFTSRGRYLRATGPSAVPQNSVHCLSPVTVEAYVRQNAARMPPKVRAWLRMLP